MTVHWLALVVVLVSPAGGAKAAPPAASDRPLLALGWMLTATDPPDPVLKKSPHRVHEVQLEAGKTYQIDLESADFDAFLRVEDAAGRPLAADDDSGGGLNPRLYFTAKAGGVYRLIATAYPKGQPGGVYTLTVRLANERVQMEQRARELSIAAAKHSQRGEYIAAEPLLRQALAIRQKALPADHPELASNLNNLGRVLQNLGRREEARQHYEQALAIYRKVLPAEHLDLATSLNNLGTLLTEFGQGEEARRHLEQALAIYKKVLPSNHILLAQSLNNLGVLLRDQGQREEARRHLEQALVIFKKALPPDHPLLAQSLNSLGGLLRQLGQHQEARRHLEQALSIRKKALPSDHPDLAMSLNNLGLLLHDLGEFKEARRHLEQALVIYKKVLPAEHPYLANSLNNLGMLLRALGQHQEARRHLEQALALFKKVLLPDHPHLANSLNNLGTLLLEMGQHEAARRYLEQALDIFKKVLPSHHPDLAICLNNLGLLLWSTGSQAEGWTFLADSVASSARYLNRMATASAQRDHAGLIAKGRFPLDILASAAVSAKSHLADRRRELLLLLLDAKGISTAALAGRRTALLEGANPKARALADELLPLQRRLADLLLQGPGQRTPQEYRKECDALQRRVDELEGELGRQVQAFALQQKMRTATPEHLAARLPAGTVLVESVRFDAWKWHADPARQGWGPPRYAAVLLWAGAKGPEVRLVDLGEANPLEQAIASWRAAVQVGKRDSAAEKTLRERLWAPLAKVLPEKTTRLIVAPDGALALVPFEAIPLEKGEYLIERYAIQYVSTGRDLMPLALPRERSDVALVLADPDYQRLQGGKAPQIADAADKLRAGLTFQSLPGFAREADAVAKLLAGHKGWRVEQARGAEASEERLAGVKRPRLLHCITHGFFLEDIKREPPKGLRDLEPVGGRPTLPSFGEDPRLRSGLALAGANKWRERSAKGLSDGLLTALEVENLDLWGTELVVLSACDTGRGEIQVGEGVLGLRRAFQLAGAQTVLASLWKVPDAETEQLMTDTLSRWLKGMSPQEALRESQLAMIRRLRAEGPRDAALGQAPPLYWAAFICHGQAR